MAEEAFALSPISARAAQPSEEDYDAISQAFMETSRGRWFLGEYARRNRNADTRMVLDAVSRIEENLAAQRQPVPDAGLPDALAAIRGAIDEAKTAAAATVDGVEFEQYLSPIHKSVRIIREIGWRLREIGADGRIWDLIDSQLVAIEAGCGQIASADPKAALNAAFDLLEGKIDKLGDRTKKSVQPAEENLPASIHDPALPEELPTEAATEADDRYDDAMLDMVATEMAAPDASDSDDRFETEPQQIPDAELTSASPEMPQTKITESEPSRSEPVRSDAVVVPTLPPAIQAALPPRIAVPAELSIDVSLGSTLIANGLVGKSRSELSDPLAPIRRMSQAEKIAFFS